MKKTEDGPVFQVDRAAVLRGGDLGGQYLDAIGKTDLGQLNGEQWALFCTKVVGGAILAAMGDVHGDTPPF